MNKQAILIMYHNDYYILERLLKQIDSEYFDIYLHIDKKVKDFDYEYTKKLLKKSNIYFSQKINVKWSTYSQIKCELLLLEMATKNHYSYYHIISGNDLLIEKNKKIYDYFNGKKNEFIGYVDMDNISDENVERIKYYHILNGNRRHKNKYIMTISTKIYYHLLAIQKKLKVNRLKNNKLILRKGANWCSITDEFANYVLTKQKEIKKMYRFSNCADELFMQTIAYNSEFKNKIYTGGNDEHQNIKRLIDWNRGEPYTYTISDYDELIKSNCFFARKFSSEKDKEIIDKIYKYTRS